MGRGLEIDPVVAGGLAAAPRIMSPAVFRPWGCASVAAAVGEAFDGFLAVAGTAGVDLVEACVAGLGVACAVVVEGEGRRRRRAWGAESRRVGRFGRWIGVSF